MSTPQDGFVDPFGYWPHHASAIASLGGPSAPDDAAYVFHTPYVLPAQGRVRFRLALQGLTATSGAMRVHLMRRADASGTARSVKQFDLALDAFARDGGELEVETTANGDAEYALHARTLAETDAAADGLTVHLDRWSQGERHAERMEEARETIFAPPTTTGRLWWKRQDPMAAAGLLRRGPATLADPVSQMCTAAQFEEPAFDTWLAALGEVKRHHRKLWEIVYILQALSHTGALRPGARGLAFGIGVERLPAAMAARGCEIVATDLAADEQWAAGWAASGQHAANLDALFYPELCDEAVFRERVTYRSVDMTDIPTDLTDFDFCWSTCAYEHLGSIEAGLRFVERSVDCLKPGGVAVHTTELNLSSNRETVDHDATVLFRKQDMERVALSLHQSGHRVFPLNYDLGDRPLDRHVDLPPYSADEHLKLALQRHVTTSFGLIVQRGPG